MRLIDLFEEKRKQQKGTYAGVNYSPETIEHIQTFLKKYKVPNPVAPEKIHTTVLYSRKFLPDFEPRGMLEEPMEAKFMGYHVWKTSPTDKTTEPWNCLIMKINCPELKDLHEKYMKEHEATYDYDKYDPHITLSYNIGNFNIDNLPKFDFPLEIVEEYSEDLNLNWAETHGTKRREQNEEFDNRSQKGLIHNKIELFH